MQFTPQTVFTASATATLTCPSAGGVVAMPAVDGSNTSVTITNNAGSSVQLLFGTSAALPIGLSQNPSALQVEVGATVLLTGAAAAVAAIATYLSISPQCGPGTVTVKRGSVSALNVFQ